MKRRRPLRWGLLALVLAVGIPLALFRPRHYAAAPGEGRSGAISAERLRALVESLPPRRSAENEEAITLTERLVQAQLKASGFRVEAQTVAHSLEGKAHFHEVVHNLIATRELAPDGRLWLIAAHLDSVTQSGGADDDGSGLAIALEVAAHTDPANAQRLMVVLFGEEENGLIGSSSWTDSLDPALRERIGGAIVLDPAGYTSHVEGSQHYPPPLGRLAPPVGDYAGVIGLWRDRALVDALVEARQRAARSLPLVTLTPPLAVVEQLPDLWRSDHAPLWRAGIPALLLTDTGNFRNPNYHRATDTPETLDYEFMAAIGDALIELLRQPPPPR